MHRAGKVSATLIVISACLIDLVAMALSSGESPTTVSARFMAALAKGDVDILTELSYFEDESEQEMRDKWEYTVDVIAPYFTFTYEIIGESRPADGSAIVAMMYTKHAGMNGSYPERFELPLIETEDGWKVNVFALNRQMYPGLPR